MWLRRIDHKNLNPVVRSGDIRYRLEWAEYPKLIMKDDGTETAAFVITDWYENNAGEWQRRWPHLDIIVSIETLLSEFVAEDSKNNEYIKELEQFKKDAQERALEEGQKLEAFDPILEIYKDKPVTQVSKDEGNKEDICTLHSGESEVDLRESHEGV